MGAGRPVRHRGNFTAGDGESAGRPLSEAPVFPDDAPDPFRLGLDRRTAALADDWLLGLPVAEDEELSYDVVQMQRFPEGDVYRAVSAVTPDGHRHALVMRVRRPEC